MKLLLTFGLSILLAMNTLTINFGANTTDWYVINDGVMGGRSSGAVVALDDSLLFKGQVSLENNGGFSSLRSPFTTYDLSDYTKVTIRYRAQDYSFAFNLATSRVWFRPVYRMQIPDTKGEWKTLTYNLKDFKEVVVGKATGKKISENQLAKVIRLGFITNEKRANNFTLEIDSIRFE